MPPVPSRPTPQLGVIAMTLTLLALSLLADGMRRLVFGVDWPVSHLLGWSVLLAERGGLALLSAILLRAARTRPVGWMRSWLTTIGGSGALYVISSREFGSGGGALREVGLMLLATLMFGTVIAPIHFWLSRELTATSSTAG